MRSRVQIFLSVVTLVTLIALPAHADFNCGARLTQGQILPAPNVSAANAATFAILNLVFDPGLERAKLNINTFGPLEGPAIAAHFHCNFAGQNGPVIIDFARYFDAAAGNRWDGNIGNGAVLPVGATCPFPVTNVAALHAAIEAGTIYAVIHTVPNLPGELRGQVFCEDD